MPHLDFTQPPFDVLSAAERQSIKKNTQVRYLAKDEMLPADDLQYFYVVLKGHVEQLLDGDFVASYLGNNHTAHLNSNDWFDSRRSPKSLIEDGLQEDKNIDSQPAAYQFRAVEDTLLLQVNGVTIDKIGAQNHFVRQLLSENLPERLKALQLRHGGKKLDATSYDDPQEVQQIMLQPVIDITLLPVHIVDADDSLYQAARTMTEAGLKHVLIRPPGHLQDKNSSDRTLGILSDNDICRAVSDQQNTVTTPCQNYASFNLRTINADNEIGDALLTMTRYRIHRLPVIDTNGKVIGVLAQGDMLAHIGHHSQLISIQINQATDLPSLATAVELIGRYIRA